MALQRAEMRMVRWCDVKVKDRLPSKELRERQGLAESSVAFEALAEEPNLILVTDSFLQFI